MRRVLQEIGVELSGSTTKSMDQIPANDIDLVVSFGDAHEQCGSLPSKAKVEKWSIPNPMRAPGESSAILSPIVTAETKSTKELQPCSWTTGAIWCRSLQSLA